MADKRERRSVHVTFRRTISSAFCGKLRRKRSLNRAPERRGLLNEGRASRLVLVEVSCAGAVEQKGSWICLRSRRHAQAQAASLNKVVVACLGVGSIVHPWGVLVKLVRDEGRKHHNLVAVIGFL